MPESTTEGNPDTFDPSTASIDDLRGQLAAPTQLDREIASDQNPELETPTEEAPEFAQEQQPEPEETDESSQETQPPQSSDTPEAGEAEVPEGETAEEEAERLKKMRVRPRDKRDQQVMDLYKSEGFEGNYQDAVNIIYGSQPDPKPEESAEQPAQDPVAEERQALETLNSEVKDLESQLESASEELDTATALKLQRTLLRKENEVARIEARIEAKQREVDQQVAQTLRQQAEESRDRALERYPVLKNTDSVERKQFDLFIQEAQNDPAQAPIFQSPRWPEIMATQFAAERGGLSAPAKTTATLDQPAATARKSAPRRATGTQARQLTSGESGEGAQAQVTAETVRESMSKMKREDLFNLLGSQS